MAITLDGTTGVTFATWTTAQRPTSPTSGQMGFNTTLGYIEYYNISSSTWVPSISLTVPITYLLVGGGGAGGTNEPNPDGDAGGGGGAGGYLTDTLNLLPGITYTITVGAGGTGSSNAAVQSTAGSNTSISGSYLATITAVGGGYGGNDDTTSNAGSGGSGGGAGSYYQGNGVPGTGTYPGSSAFYTPLRQGFDGAGTTNGQIGTRAGAGGGGSASAGSTRSGNTGGAGGGGTSNGLSGSIVTYAAGGSGGTVGTSGSNGAAGAANTGNGGGGSSPRNNAGVAFAGGNGGSGIAIIVSQQAAVSTTGSPTITTSNGFYIYRFTSSGTITF